MILSNDEITLELIAEDSHYDPSSADNIRTYDRILDLSGSISTAHGVRVTSGDQLVASVIVFAGGGVSGIHTHSAILREDALFLAVGSCVVRLHIPSLDLVWFAETDEATCFGVHEIADSPDFVSHGEISISRMTEAGAMVWSGSGADIFTGPLLVLPTEVRISDFDEQVYSFDLRTGASMLLSPP
jgi:hypothetical protein